jgi:mono/diheme cytochrome c family protein
LTPGYTRLIRTRTDISLLLIASGAGAVNSQVRGIKEIMKMISQSFISTCFVLGVASLSAAGAFAADAAAGKTLYTAKCRTCHGADGIGNPGMAKALSAEIKPLGSDDVQKKSDADLKSNVTAGVGKMKPIAVAGGDLDNVVAYIRSLKK